MVSVVHQYTPGFKFPFYISLGNNYFVNLLYVGCTQQHTLFLYSVIKIMREFSYLHLRLMMFGLQNHVYVLCFPFLQQNTPFQLIFCLQGFNLSRLQI